MKTHYTFADGHPAACEGTAQRPEVVLYRGVDAADRTEILQRHKVEARDLALALDPDESPRVHLSSDSVAVIWKEPKNVSITEQVRFDVASVGLFFRQGTLVIVASEDLPALGGHEFTHCANAADVLLHVLDLTVRHYLGHLKVIRQMATELGSKITDSMENQYLLQMLAIGESLIYYIDAIEANGAVLARLQRHPDWLALTTRQGEVLTELIFNNQQCARQARIYSDVVSGLMDARGTIINNNVSVLLKKLTLINIVFLPLNLIAGIGGMSEFTMMTQGIDWRVSYSLFMLGTVGLGWVGWHALVHVLERKHNSRKI